MDETFVQKLGNFCPKGKVSPIQRMVSNLRNEKNAYLKFDLKIFIIQKYLFYKNKKDFRLIYLAPFRCIPKLKTCHKL